MYYDNILLLDEAKLNISKLIDQKRNEYKKSQSIEIKKELINLLNDRKELFLFNKNIIKKYTQKD